MLAILYTLVNLTRQKPIHTSHVITFNHEGHEVSGYIIHEKEAVRLRLYSTHSTYLNFLTNNNNIAFYSWLNEEDADEDELTGISGKIENFKRMLYDFCLKLTKGTAKVDTERLEEMLAKKMVHRSEISVCIDNRNPPSILTDGIVKVYNMHSDDDPESLICTFKHLDLSTPGYGHGILTFGQKLRIGVIFTILVIAIIKCTIGIIMRLKQSEITLEKLINAPTYRQRALMYVFMASIVCGLWILLQYYTKQQVTGKIWK